MKIENITAPLVLSELQEAFENVRIAITDDSGVKYSKGIAYIRGIMVEVRKAKKDNAVWRIVDEAYEELEELEKYNCLTPWDDKESWDDLVSQLEDAYSQVDMPANFWRIPSPITNRRVFRVDSEGDLQPLSFDTVVHVTHKKNGKNRGYTYLVNARYAVVEADDVTWFVDE